MGDNVRKTLREMKEMMKALCEKVKKNEKCLKEIKDLQQRLGLIIFCTHYLLLCIMSLLGTLIVDHNWLC